MYDKAILKIIKQQNDLLKKENERLISENKTIKKDCENKSEQLVKARSEYEKLIKELKKYKELYSKAYELISRLRDKLEFNAEEIRESYAKDLKK